MLFVKQKKSDKNYYGYLKKGKRVEFLFTILLFATSFFLYFLGFLLTKTNRNGFSIVAVLGILPASKHLVHLLVFLKGSECQEPDYTQFKKYEMKLNIYYDFIFTTHTKNYYLESLIVHEHHLIGFHKGNKEENKKTEIYLRDVIMQNGYHNYTVKIFDNQDDYTNRIHTIHEAIHKKIENKHTQALVILLKSISM